MNKTYKDFENYLKEFPDKNGRFGEYGGQYLPPELMPAFKEIDEAYETICRSAQFISELRRIRKEFQGRPTPVYHCERLSRKLGKCQIYLKREDLTTQVLISSITAWVKVCLPNLWARKSLLPKQVQVSTA